MSNPTLTGTETLQVLAIAANGSPAATTQTTTTGAIAALAVSNTNAPVAGGSTITAVGGQVINLNTLTGTAVTLPTATGSGQKVKCIVSVVATSNGHTITCAGTDTMIGTVLTNDSATVTGYAAVAGTSALITLNSTTTGGLKKGDFVELLDDATGIWAVYGITNSSGTAATPFSA